MISREPRLNVRFQERAAHAVRLAFEKSRTGLHAPRSLLIRGRSLSGKAFIAQSVLSECGAHSRVTSVISPGVGDVAMALSHGGPVVCIRHAHYLTSPNVTALSEILCGRPATFESALGKFDVGANNLRVIVVCVVDGPVEKEVSDTIARLAASCQTHTAIDDPTDEDLLDALSQYVEACTARRRMELPTWFLTSPRSELISKLSTAWRNRGWLGLFDVASSEDLESSER